MEKDGRETEKEKVCVCVCKRHTKRQRVRKLVRGTDTGVNFLSLCLT